MQPLSGNQRPDLLTALMNMSLVLRLPREMHLCRSSSSVPRLPSFLEMLQNPHVLLTLRKCTIPCACHAKRHLNVQKWSGAEVFCTFWLRNVLRATTACTFSTSQLLKVLQCWSVLYILTWKCASRHNGVHFFDTSNSKSGPEPAPSNEDGLFLRGRPLAPKRSMPGHAQASRIGPWIKQATISSDREQKQICLGQLQVHLLYFWVEAPANALSPLKCLLQPTAAIEGAQDRRRCSG